MDTDTILRVLYYGLCHCRFSVSNQELFLIMKIILSYSPLLEQEEEVEKHLDMPPSWVQNIELDQKGKKCHNITF